MIAYILKSSLSLIILFGLYWCLLRKEKLFEFNRFFLIISLVFSLLVPLISIPVNFRTLPRLENLIPVSNNSPTEIVLADNSVPDPVGENRQNSELQPGVISFSAILLTLYFSGVLLLLVRFLRNIYVLIRRTKSSEKTFQKGYQIVLTNNKIDPCCFFNTIFLYRDDYLNGRIDKELLDHEMEHAKQSHTIDIIIIEIVRIFYWFNPVYILYDRAIRINHEYLADNAVIKDVPDIRSYADKLVSFITWRSSISLTSNSNSSFTRMRLIMMMRSKSGSFSYGTKIAFTLCSGVLLFLFLGLKETDFQPVKTDLSGPGTIVSQNVVRGKVITEDGKPLEGVRITCFGTFGKVRTATSGPDGLFIINDVTEDASLTFYGVLYKAQTLNPDFKSDMTVKMVRNPDYNGTFLNNKLIFKVEGPKIQFLDGPDTPSGALIVINGKISDKRGEAIIYFENIKSFNDFMKSINVLKDKAATDKYGEKGKEGVIEIVTKGNSPDSVIKMPAKPSFSQFSSIEKPLIIVDGVVYTKALNDIKADDIESLNTISGVTATKKYGEEGKNGVIEIKTKKRAKEKIEQNKENSSNPWWVSIAKLRNIDLKEFHTQITFSMRKRDSSVIRVFLAGKNDSLGMQRIDGKIQSFELIEPILILKDTIGYELLKAKSAYQDLQNNQILFGKGSIEHFRFGEEWLEAPKYANDIKPGKKVTFDNSILNTRTNEWTFNTASGTVNFK